MNWKEFLRPTIPKIILVIVLFLILPFIPAEKGCEYDLVEGPGEMPPCPIIFINGIYLILEILEYSLNVLPTIFSGMSIAPVMVRTLQRLFFTGIFAAFVFAILYLISCGIVQAYKKIRVKK